jgi:hypothetical protein
MQILINLFQNLTTKKKPQLKLLLPPAEIIGSGVDSSDDN